MLALRALHLHVGAGLRAALFDGRQRAQVLRGEPLTVLRQEILFEGRDDLCEADHFSAPQVMQKPSIRASMRARAWCLV